MRYRLVAQWLAIALAATSFAPSVSIRALADGASHAATLSAAEIRSGIAGAQARITAFRITYEVAYPSDEGWPAGTYLRRTVAAMADVFLLPRDVAWAG